MEMESHLRTLSSDSLGELAYQSIRGAIMDGEIPMGTRLVESALVGQLGVSRGLIREALGRLSEEGLVVDVPRKGAFVQQLGVDAFVDLCNVRVPLEITAVRLLVRGSVPLTSLEARVQAMRAAADRDDRAAVDAEDFALHEDICRLSGNDHLARLFRSLWAQLRLSMTMDDGASESLSRIVDRHDTLVEILSSGDESAAVTAIENHILAAAEGVVERLGGSAKYLLRQVSHTEGACP
jgi:DNA-binding GntR family transcriptional regulator